MAKQASIQLKNLTKEYVTHEGTGTFLAVDHINVDIASGQFVTLLGPSGCGKTTTLRMIAGFEGISDGEILLDGVRINELTPDKRDSSMVFQSYALFPHYDVYDNVGYGLVNKKMDKKTIEEKVMKMLDLVGLKGMEHRMPNQLSGGQQQRVALARALVMEPAVLLFITSVYVTHDQSEAMALSDKVIIMNGGKIEQVGSPTEIYQYPASHFVADFIGSANFVPARVKSVSSQGTRLESKAGPGMEIGTAVVEMFGQEFTAKCIQGELAAGDTVEVVIRPEAIELADDGDVKAEVTSSTYMGQMQDYVVQVGEQELVTQTYNPSSKKVYKPGETVYLRIQRESLHAIKK